MAEEDVELEAIFEEIHTEGIEDMAEDNLVISVSNCSIAVAGADHQMLYIFDVNGRMIVRESAIDHKQYRMPSTGVYLVKVGNRAAQKVVVVK